ncbi:hypothetical protein GF373_12935 [bacterium]|nr:hypothetical protein [bacterium]
MWCTLQPESTASFLGFTFASIEGKVEYITVYGGMELGFAVFFALTASLPSLRLPGLYFACCLYSGIFLFRMGSLLLLGWDRSWILGMAGLEAVLVSWAFFLLSLKTKQANPA